VSAVVLEECPPMSSQPMQGAVRPDDAKFPDACAAICSGNSLLESFISLCPVFRMNAGQEIAEADSAIDRQAQ